MSPPTIVGYSRYDSDGSMHVTSLTDSNGVQVFTYYDLYAVYSDGSRVLIEGSMYYSSSSTTPILGWTIYSSTQIMACNHRATNSYQRTNHGRFQYWSISNASWTSTTYPRTVETNIPEFDDIFNNGYLLVSELIE